MRVNNFGTLWYDIYIKKLKAYLNQINQVRYANIKTIKCRCLIIKTKMYHNLHCK